MFILSRPARMNDGLQAAMPASMRHALVAILLACVGFRAAEAAPLEGRRLVESDGWKARITVDCLLKDKVCGTFRYETLACEGDLVYSGETPAGFEFRAELRAGRCLPGCTLRVSSDFRRYVEVCRDASHEGALTDVAAPAPAPVRSAAAAPMASSAPAGATPGEKKPTGRVHVKWDNGDVFDGDMVEGRRNGKGRFVWANGQTYDGDWRDDVAVGEGTLVFVNGDRFQGQVKDGIPDGRGRMQFANGDSYEGQIDKGILEGEGVYTAKDGSRYEGQWKAGVRDGRGRFMWPSGQRYDGDWVADKAEGQGSLTFANGDRYEGQVGNGLPQGKGVKTFASMDRYEGQFAQGEPNGEGVYRWKNGDVYAGSWQKGSKVGKGRYTWAGGDYWEGEFAADKKTENGRLYFTPKATAASTDASTLALRADSVASPAETGAGGAKPARTDDKPLDPAKLLAIPMVAKEVRECSRKQGGDCAKRVVDDVLSDNLQPHKWQTMASEKDAKGKASIFEVDANSVLEGGNVYSWLRSGDGTRSRNIGIKYDCRARALEIQLVYHCTGSEACLLDPNIDKYAGKILPATEIKDWFKEACER